MIRYLVVQPSFNWAQPGAYQSGTVISSHKSIAAAYAGIERATRRLQRQAGMHQSWYDWYVIAEDGGQRRRLTEDEIREARP